MRPVFVRIGDDVRIHMGREMRLHRIAQIDDDLNTWIMNLMWSGSRNLKVILRSQIWVNVMGEIS